MTTAGPVDRNWILQDYLSVNSTKGLTREFCPTPSKRWAHDPIAIEYNETTTFTWLFGRGIRVSGRPSEGRRTCQ